MSSNDIGDIIDSTLLLSADYISVLPIAFSFVCLLESVEREKTMNEIDKIMSQAQQFYQDTADQEGRGRFPGQGRYDMCVGGDNHGTRDVGETTHESERTDAENDLFGIYDTATDTWSGGYFNSFEDQNAAGWLSVFG